MTLGYIDSKQMDGPIDLCHSNDMHPLHMKPSRGEAWRTSLKVVVSLSKPFALRRVGKWDVCCVCAIQRPQPLWNLPSLQVSFWEQRGTDGVGVSRRSSAAALTLLMGEEMGRKSRVTDHYSFGNWISYWVLDCKFGIYCQVTEFIAFQNRCSNATVHWNHLCARWIGWRQTRNWFVHLSHLLYFLK